MSRRVVVKVGTGVLTRKDGQIDESVIASLVADVVVLKEAGCEVVIVTSGAVGSGRSLLKLPGEESTEDKQVFAAIGQVKLMQTYAKYFDKKKYLCAQVLATKEDFRDRTHYLNMRRCFQNLLKDNVVPIVNENDVVAIRELVFTDNDELAGLVALQLEADALIILTSVDGVMDGESKLISRIDSKSVRGMERHIRKDISASGRGGMTSKFATARKLMGKGIWVHIANGKKKGVLTGLFAGKDIGTTFMPSKLN